MSDDKVFDFNKNPEIIKHYDILKKTGVLDAMLDLEKKNKQLEELLESAVTISNQHTIQDLVNTIANDLLDKFVPSYLVFIIQEEFSPNNSYMISFNNLKPVKNIIKIDSLGPYLEYFALMPNMVTFDVFKYTMDEDDYTNVFLPLSPEILVPMMYLDKMYGFIIFGRKVIDADYTPQEKTYIDRMMTFASANLQNNIHYTQAIMESKTGLYNYAFFIRKMNEELSRMKRYKGHFSLIMMDIDFFKNINDTYGHLAGDMILMELAKILENQIRNGDIAARYGGEEFVILLYQADIENAYKIAERMRQFILEKEFDYEGKIINITISIGLTFVDKENIKTAAEIIAQSDKALYKAKGNGRNQSVIFSPELDKTKDEKNK